MRTPTYCIIILLILACFEIRGQDRGRKKLYPTAKKTGPAKQRDTFLDKQWYLGLRGGINLTQAVPDRRFSTISPINFDETQTEKSYQDFNKLGVQIGLDFTYTFSGWAFSLQPTYIRERFTYTNEFAWQDTSSPDNTLMLDLSQDNELEYLELPFLVKYEFIDGPLKPFVTLGAYYGALVNANKSVSFSGSDTASGGASDFERDDFSVGASDLFLTSQGGLLGGAGVHYDPGNIRVTIDILYRYGLHNIADRQNRYSDNRLVGVGDVLDDLSLRNISLNVGVLFPLRFLSTTFKSNS